MTRFYRFTRAETGSALIVAMIFLLLMTLIGTAAMRGSTMQERMASNWRDWNLAFQSAEAALREAERFLLDTAVLPEFDDQDGFYQVNAATRPVWTGADFSDDGNGAVEFAVNLPDVAKQPQYFIEELATITPPGTETETGTELEDVFYFRVTAIGYGGAIDNGGDPITAVTLSTVYRSR
jgi:type IV pilus assembly protein PilX